MKLNALIPATAFASLAVGLPLPATAAGRQVHPPQDTYQDQSAAAIVDSATRRAHNEPGVTREFSPEARQTATGGPSGGIPNQSGGP